MRRPGCGAEVPLIRSLWLAKKANRSVALATGAEANGEACRFRNHRQEASGWVDASDPRAKSPRSKVDGTVKGGSATCPCCGYTTPVASVRSN